MSTSPDLPLYNSELVTVPVIAEMLPRRRSLPSRVGPWPIRRSHSETHPDKKVSFPDFGSRWTESKHKPTLGVVLKQIDEECARIDTSVEEELAVTSSKDNGRSSNEENREQRRISRRSSVERARTNILLVTMVLALFVTFVWPPMMTFVFANKKFGKIVLKAEAPSVMVFSTLLAVPTITISMALTMSIYVVNEVKHRRNMFQQQHKFLLVVVGGFWTGIMMNVWMFIWLLPLIEHK